MEARSAQSNRDMEANRLIEYNFPPVGDIVCGDCVSVMSEWASDSVDAIYADPPYNASTGAILSLPKNKTGGAYYKIREKWDSFSEQDYALFTDAWVNQATRLLKKSGNMFVACSMHNIADVIQSGKKCGLKLNNIITWQKSNAMPSITKRTFTHTAEYTCWFSNGSGWTFNYFDVKKYNPEKTKDGKEKQMPDFVRLPIVQGKERLRRKGENRALHPSQKPEKLIEIFLAAGTNPSDIVLDPFMGSGTTAVVAEKMGRQWVGIESDADYIDAANKRICAARE